MKSLKYTITLLLGLLCLNQIFAHTTAELNFPFQHNIACSLYSTYPQTHQIQGSILISSARRLSPSGQILSCLENRDSNSSQVENDENFIRCIPNISINVSMHEISELPDVLIFTSSNLHSLVIQSDRIAEFEQALIYNVAGELLIQQKIENHPDNYINIDFLPKGLYFVTFTHRNGKVVKKFVKQ